MPKPAIFSIRSTNAGRCHRPASAPSSGKASGISRSATVKALLQMLSWIVFLTIHIKSTLRALIHRKTFPRERNIDLILLRPSNYKQVAPLVQTGGSHHTGLAALPHCNIQMQRLSLSNSSELSYNPPPIAYFHLFKKSGKPKLPGYAFFVKAGTHLPVS